MDGNERGSRSAGLLLALCVGTGVLGLLMCLASLIFPAIVGQSAVYLLAAALSFGLAANAFLRR